MKGTFTSSDATKVPFTSRHAGKVPFSPPGPGRCVQTSDAQAVQELALQAFQLTGDADYGSGTTLATADANLAGTRVVLNTIRPLVQQRDAAGLADIDAWLDRFGAVVDATQHSDGSWTPVDQLAQADRQRINGTLGALLEKLAVVPDLLEIRKAT